MNTSERSTTSQVQVAITAFLALFSIVGLALYGLPLYYDFMVKEFGWSRTQVTSGNALSKLVIGPLFGFIAGWVVDRFGPRRLMTSLTVCHCEERSDAAIHSFLARQDGLLRFARNDELTDRAQFTELLTTTSISLAPGRLKADDSTDFN